MLTAAIAGIIAFIVFYIIGLFNKRVGRNMKVIIFHARRLRASRHNMRKLRRQARQAKRIIRRRKLGLLFKKLSRVYQDNLLTTKKSGL